MHMMRTKGIESLESATATPQMMNFVSSSARIVYVEGLTGCRLVG